MRISDWSSDVCSSDLRGPHGAGAGGSEAGGRHPRRAADRHPRLRPHDAGREAGRDPRCAAHGSPAMTDKPETRDRFPHFLPLPTPWMDNDIYGHVNNVVSYASFSTLITAYLPRQGGPDLPHGHLGPLL